MKLALKETESMAEIMKAFDGPRMVHQYLVGCYRIDLHFQDYGLAVECDEYGHSQYSLEKEADRSAFIDQQLACKWVRCDTDS